MSGVDIGERIKCRRLELQYTQDQVAKALGITRASIAQWENDRTKPRGQSLHGLANILRVTAAWLLTGEVEDNENQPNLNGSNDSQSVPLISYEQAASWHELAAKLNSIRAQDWLRSANKLGPRAFALTMEGDSMLNPTGFPSIPQGSYVFFDPDVTPLNGHIVAVRNHEGDITIKKLTVDFNHTVLRPLNPRYQDIIIDDLEGVIGVACSVLLNIL